MDMFGIYALTFCCWCVAGAGAYRSTDVPSILVPEDEVEVDQQVKVNCLVPIDYGGGRCRLFRHGSSRAIRTTKADYFVCRFTLPARELLGSKPVGSRVLFHCDYQLQQYTSALSDLAGVTVRGWSPSPYLEAWPRLLTPLDTLQVRCVPPGGAAHKCNFYRGEVRIQSGSCTQNLPGRQLSLWLKDSVLLAVNMTCRYDPVPDLDLRSHPSNHVLVYLVDPELAATPLDCSVPSGVGLNATQTLVGSGGQRITVHFNNSSSLQASSEHCRLISN